MLKIIKNFTVHFNERVIQRFQKEDLPLLDKVVENLHTMCLLLSMY
ncbi:MAG: hypothetical protein KBE02_01440 [Sulfurospirillum sp.]|nr:hypothetical protein [Sulfurospirillum sp.]